MKTPRLITLLAVAGLLAPLPLAAQIVLPNSLEAFVRGGAANAGVDQNEATIGYIMVKYDAPLTVARKAYFKFDFAGQTPNTNALLRLRFATFTNNQRQHIQVWTLNQDYPAFTTPVLTWNDAQANDLTGNGLLITGDFTATPRTDFISPNSANASVNVVIPPPWGDALINEKIHLTLGTLSNSLNAANGTRIVLNSTSLEFTPITSGMPPTISAIQNITTIATLESPTNSFTVGDPEDGPDALAPFAISSNEGVVASANVFFEGTGANRTVHVIGSAAGTATITVTVYDSAGNPADRLFTVTVLPLNFAPVISTPPPAHTQLNTPVVVPFTVEDTESPATNLTVFAEIAPHSAGILAEVTVGSDETGTNRTVTVTPVADANGVGVVRLQVSDPEGSLATVSFGVMVLAAPNLVFNDHFDYPDATIGLFPGSANLWARRSVSAGAVNFSTQSGAAYIRPRSNADDGAAQLAGGPYTPASRAVLYAKASATWIDVGGEFATNSVGGGFFALSQSGTATSILVADVATSLSGGPEGNFGLGLWDLAGVVQPYPGDAIPSFGGPYTIVTRYDVASARSTLWVNATSEADPHVSASDANTPVSINYIGLRQDQGMGFILVDDVQVILAITPLLTAGGPVPGGNVDLFFAAGATDTIGDFAVEGATSVAGQYSNVTATITSLGDGNFKAIVPAMTPEHGFYRVKRLPMTF